MVVLAYISTNKVLVSSPPSLAPHPSFVDFGEKKRKMTILIGMRWNLIVVFICIFLIYSDSFVFFFSVCWPFVLHSLKITNSSSSHSNAEMRSTCSCFVFPHLGTGVCCFPSDSFYILNMLLQLSGVSIASGDIQRYQRNQQFRYCYIRLERSFSVQVWCGSPRWHRCWAW